MTSTTFRVLKVECASCVIAMEGICEDIPGVRKAELNARQRTLIVEHDDTVSPTRIKQALENEGYPVEPA